MIILAHPSFSTLSTPNFWSTLGRNIKGNSPLNFHLTYLQSFPKIPLYPKENYMAQALPVLTILVLMCFTLLVFPLECLPFSLTYLSFPRWATKNSCRLKTTDLCEPCPFSIAHSYFISRSSSLIILQPAPPTKPARC